MRGRIIWGMREWLSFHLILDLNSLTLDLAVSHVASSPSHRRQNKHCSLVRHALTLNYCRLNPYRSLALHVTRGWITPKKYNPSEAFSCIGRSAKLCNCRNYNSDIGFVALWRISINLCNCSGKKAFGKISLGTIHIFPLLVRFATIFSRLLWLLPMPALLCLKTGIRFCSEYLYWSTNLDTVQLWQQLGRQPRSSSPAKT